jgi:hypothetical protein
MAAWVSRLVGLTLVAAALLKAGGGPMDPTSWTALPAVFQPFLIGYELVLGGLLLSGWWPVTLRWVAVATFSLFAAASLWAGLNGQASCGCLGAVRVSPWAIFGFDVAAVGALLAFRPRSATVPTPGRQAIAGYLTAVCFVCLLVGGRAIGRYCSLRAAVSALRGEGVVADPLVYDLETALDGLRWEAVVRLVNRSPRPVRVVGGVSDCSCVATADLPADIAPGQSAELRVTVSPGKVTGPWYRLVKFLTDSPSTPAVEVGLIGGAKSG